METIDDILTKIQSLRARNKKIEKIILRYDVADAVTTDLKCSDCNTEFSVVHLDNSMFGIPVEVEPLDHCFPPYAFIYNEIEGG